MAGWLARMAALLDSWIIGWLVLMVLVVVVVDGCADALLPLFAFIETCIVCYLRCTAKTFSIWIFHHSPLR